MLKPTRRGRRKKESKKKKQLSPKISFCFDFFLPSIMSSAYTGFSWGCKPKQERLFNNVQPRRSSARALPRRDTSATRQQLRS